MIQDTHTDTRSNFISVVYIYVSSIYQCTLHQAALNTHYAKLAQIIPVADALHNALLKDGFRSA